MSESRDRPCHSAEDSEIFTRNSLLSDSSTRKSRLDIEATSDDRDLEFAAYGDSFFPSDADAGGNLASGSLLLRRRCGGSKQLDSLRWYIAAALTCGFLAVVDAKGYSDTPTTCTDGDGSAERFCSRCENTDRYLAAIRPCFSTILLTPPCTLCRQ